MTENIYAMSAEDLENGKKIIKFFATLGVSENDIDKLVFLAKNSDKIIEILNKLSTSVNLISDTVLQRKQEELAKKANALMAEYSHREELNLNA